MSEAWPELALVFTLIVLNGVLAGSEVALISLREPQLRRLERGGGMGRVVASLARNPNRYLATIQIGITLAGFLASAVAAVSIAEPLVPYLAFLGPTAETVAVMTVTLILSYLTLVFGELAPKRLALQKAEGWARVVAGPLHWMSVVSKPAVWLLSISTDLAVRLMGGEPGSTGEEVDLEELRELIVAHRALAEEHQEVLLGAFEVGERTLRQVMVPRRDLVTLEEGMRAGEAMSVLVAAGKSRAPVVPDRGGLDRARGIVGLRDLVVDPERRVGDVVMEAVALPESVPVLSALRTLQEARQQMALVVNEFGGIDGIVTVEDLVEELVGEIYDESDRDVITARREPDGSVVVDGRFPVHDLIDLDVEVPEGDYTTVAGLVLSHLGEIPRQPGARVEVGGWEATVLSLRRHTIGRVRFRPAPDGSD